MRRVYLFCMIVVIGGLLGGDAYGQMFGRGGRGGRGFDRRGPSPFSMTDEQREEMYDRMIGYYQERYTDTYELDGTQREAVKARLEELKAEQKAYSESVREEYQRIGSEVRSLFEKRQAGEEVDHDQMHELFSQMHEMRENSPLMSRDNVTQQVEALLPPGQVQQGRARAEQRHEERRREWEERRARQADQDGDQGSDERGFGRRGGQDGDQGRGRRGFGRPDGGSFFDQDRWDRYVEQFEERYGLNESQQAAVDSIVRELKGRRDSYNDAHQARFNALSQMASRDRWDAYRELNEPIDEMFTQLRQRLDQIPTLAQKEAGGPMPDYWNRDRSSRRRGPDSAPAGATTRPAGVTTPPAQD